MTLDLRTASFFISIVSLLAAGTMLLFARLARSYHGINYWAIGNSFAALGLILIMYRDFIPAFLSIVLGNLLIIVALGLALYGVALFVDRPIRLRLILSLFIVFFLLISYFTYVNDNINVRIVIYGVASSLLTLVAAWLLLRAATPQHRLSYTFTGITFALFSLLSFLRSIGIFFLEPVQNLFAPTGLQVTSFVLGMIFIPMWSLGAAVMIVQRMVEELEGHATIDFLTQMLNRRGAELRLGSEMARARRSSKPFSVLLLDVDNLKETNDRYGHRAGDALIRSVALTLWELMRFEDVVSRWGGDEFLVILGGSIAGVAEQVAKRILTTIESRNFTCDGHSIHCTLSIGIATALPSDEGLEAIIARADRGLYQAKRLGRNQAVLSGERIPESVGAAPNPN
jgi:diguanylate cyclase (GGDEF)-like protein